MTSGFDSSFLKMLLVTATLIAPGSSYADTPEASPPTTTEESYSTVDEGLAGGVDLAALTASAPVQPHAQDSGDTVVGGYGELHGSWADKNRMNNGSAKFDKTSKIWDFHRFVTFLGHKFSDKIRFFSELEVEHAFVEGGEEKGEIELEQAFLDFSLQPQINIRAGILLAPIGIVNETHEPPTFNTVERGRYNKELIPTTWFDAGAGIHGIIANQLSYQLYLMAGLNGSQFSSDGIRSGRQEGFKSSAANPSVAARTVWRGIEGVAIGASLFAGGTGNGNYNVGAGLFAAPVVLAAFDIDVRKSGFLLRAEAGQWWIDANDLNAAFHSNATGVTQPGAVARNIAGFYVETGYDLGNHIASQWVAALIPFARMDLIDKNSTPAKDLAWNGALANLDLTFGLHYKPLYNVSVKFDWLLAQDVDYLARKDGGRGSSTIELGLGYFF